MSVAFKGCFSFKLHVRLNWHQMQRCKESRQGCVACGSYLCIFKLCILLCLHWSRVLRDMIGSRIVTAIKKLSWSSVAGEVCRYQLQMAAQVSNWNKRAAINPLACISKTSWLVLLIGRYCFSFSWSSPANILHAVSSNAKMCIPENWPVKRCWFCLVLSKLIISIQRLYTLGSISTF